MELCVCCGNKATDWVYDEDGRRDPYCSDCVNEGLFEGYITSYQLEEIE